MPYAVLITTPHWGGAVIGCKIRGRGNHSWKGSPKKQYKIKFNEKQPIFGFSSNKDWILLGDYDDKTLMRTAYMSEVSKLVGLAKTIDYQHVELYLNNEYLGTYIFTSHVEKAKNRINIDKNGYIIENDRYYKNEPLFFLTSIFHYNYTFKYPDPDDGEIVLDDENYTFIRTYMNTLEESLLKIEEGDETYLSYIDLRSFAKWYLVAEITGNLEPNLYFVLPSKTSKIMMYPLWDSECSLGYCARGTDYAGIWALPPAKSPIDVEAWKYENYFKYLFQSRKFVETVKEEWIKFKPHIPELKKKILDVRGSLIYTQEDNFKKWDILGQYISIALVAFDTWEEECNYIEEFLDRRLEWLDDYILNQ